LKEITGRGFTLHCEALAGKLLQLCSEKPFVGSRKFNPKSDLIEIGCSVWRRTAIIHSAWERRRFVKILQKEGELC
jgi:hypothetical protein